MISSNYIFILILVIIIGSYLLETVLSIINSSRFSFPLPERLSSIYTADKYSLYQQYLKEKSVFSMIHEAFNFIVIFVILIVGGFSWLDDLVRQLTESPIFLSLLFFAILGFSYDLIGIPFEWYFMPEPLYTLFLKSPSYNIFSLL